MNEPHEVDPGDSEAARMLAKIRELQRDLEAAGRERESLRDALVQARAALAVIDHSRHEPADVQQRAAVAELRRIIAAADAALSGRRSDQR